MQSRHSKKIAIMGKKEISVNQMKSFSKLMDRYDKAKKESEFARTKEYDAKIVMNKRAKFLGIGNH